MVKLGWKVIFDDDPLGALNVAVHSDQAGFDFIDLCNPKLSESNPQRASLNWSWLGAAAAKTQRMQLGTCIPDSIFRRDPMVTAEILQTLAAISSDRVFLTILVDDDKTGPVDYWKDQNEHQDILAEGIALMRALWKSGTVTYNSHYYHTRKVELKIQVDQPPPIYLAVQQPGYAYTAGVYGDGIVAMAGMQSIVYRRILDEFNRGVQDAGKDPQQMVRMVELPVVYTLDEEPEWIPVESAWAVDWLDLEVGEDVFIPVTADGKYRTGARSIQPELYSSNDPDCHAAFAQSYIDLGFNSLVFSSLGAEPLGSLQSYARDVLPRIRASNLPV